MLSDIEIAQQVKMQPVTEIAEKLGVSVNTVKTHKSRGFRSLRSKLQDSVCLFLI